MAISIEKFIAQTPAKRGRRRSSKIWNFAEEVLKLRKLGYSYEQIQIFLQENKVEVKYQTLISFVRRFEQRQEEEAEASKTGAGSEDLAERAAVQSAPRARRPT